MAAALEVCSMEIRDQFGEEGTRAFRVERTHENGNVTIVDFAMWEGPVDDENDDELHEPPRYQRDRGPGLLARMIGRVLAWWAVRRAEREYRQLLATRTWREGDPCVMAMDDGQVCGAPATHGWDDRPVCLAHFMDLIRGK